MKNAKILVASLLLGLMLLSACGGKSASIVVGAKDFTEQDILGNILTVLIEEHTDLKVDYKGNMGSNVLFAALQSGDVDISVDYTGTVYGNYLGYSEMKSADEVYDISARDLQEKYQLKMLNAIGFNNTYTLAVRPDTAEEFGLKTYSDLAKVADQLVFGGTFEILNRNDGIPELKKMYDFSFKEEKAVDNVLRYTAISSGETQVIDAFSTDGLLLEYNLVVLEDDKAFFPPYHAVPIIREETAQKYPELLTVLDKLTGTLDDDAIRELNYKVDVLKENSKDVAMEFLRASGLIG